MADVFISYSHEDRFFAELVEVKFLGKEISVWRDTRSLAGGAKWKSEIDAGIDKCKVLVLVLSPSSSNSNYVTYEWARAIAFGKSIIPIYNSETKMHQKLEEIQYIDFRHHNDESWLRLVDQVKSVISGSEQVVGGVPGGDSEGIAMSDDAQNSKKAADIELANKVRNYLNEKGYRAMSFDRIRSNIDKDATDEILGQMINASAYFRPVKVRPGPGEPKSGLILK